MLFFIHFPHFTGLRSITSITSHIVRLKSQVIDFCQRSRFSDFLSLFFSLLIILFFCFFLPVFCIGGFYILLLARTGVPLSSSSTFLSFGSSLFQACFRISDKKRNNNNRVSVHRLTSVVAPTAATVLTLIVIRIVKRPFSYNRNHIVLVDGFSFQ